MSKTADRTKDPCFKHSVCLMSCRNNLQILSSYKRLLRATDKSFAGDEPAIITIKNKIRSQFEKSKNIKDPSEIQQFLKEATEFEKVIRGVVQAKLNDKGNYEIKVPKDFPSGATIEPVTKD